ncbi:hypothetical protein MML48_2g00018009 [Holotrichia oblita]|uniref:Uncharacterized protein n=1 Tax=Holotrichia oblita TaxID=644536 RepID=A0ACB9TIV4_HOLOL|nr:hypothetical protein MML48_2g00018009 [Holotrichia oblita]
MYKLIIVAVCAVSLGSCAPGLRDTAGAEGGHFQSISISGHGGFGDKSGFSAGSGLKSIAEGSAQQANNAVANQHAAARQAAFAAKSSLAQNAISAAATAQAALTAKQILVSKLESDVNEAQQSLQGEIQQLHQAERSANSAQQAAEQAQQQQAAEEAQAEYGSQQAMVGAAKQRLSALNEELHAAQNDLVATQAAAQKAGAAAQIAQSNAANAAASAQAAGQEHGGGVGFGGDDHGYSAGGYSVEHLNMTIDDPINESDIKEILRDFLAEKGIEDAEIIYRDGPNLGDGYLGVTKAITVKKGETSFDLFVKAAPKDEKLRVALNTHMIFKREVAVYTKLFPAYNKFLQEKIGQELNLTPKCYNSNAEESREFLLLENLNDLGFKMFDKRKLLDEDHILIVLKNYAKFHGVSYALKNQRGDVFANLCQTIGDDTMFLFENVNFKTILSNGLDVLKEYGGAKIDSNSLEKVEELIENFYEFIEETINCNHNHKIITHSDCWMNNMQFKYDDDTKKPVDLRLVDFQAVRQTLPVTDLSYFFYCSANTQENLDKLDFYLDYYYENLKDFLEKLGNDVDKIYPHDTFKDDWKRFCKYGIMMTLSITRVIVAETGETLNVAEKMRTDPEEARKALFVVIK